MSVGHLARVLEENNISTVCVFIRAFRHEAERRKVPRTLVTPHLLGRTIGPPGDADRQRKVVRAALDILESSREPGVIVDFSPEGAR